MEILHPSTEVEIASLLRASSVRLRNLSPSQQAKFSVAVAVWLKRYGDWLSEKCGIDRAENLHLIYNRTVAFRDPPALSPPGPLLEMMRSALAGGLTTNLWLRLDVAIRDQDSLLAVLGEGLVSGLTLAHESDRPTEGHSTADVVAFLTELKQHVSAFFFVGHYGFWRETVLAPAILDHTTFTLLPVSTNKVRRHNCLGAVGCHVMEDGSIFACENLEGVPAAKLGSVYDSESFNPMHLPLTRQLLQLNLHRPDCATGMSPRHRIEGLMCKRHIEQLLAAS